MTGAGKTHTMLGDIYNTTTGEVGICSLAIDALFKELEEKKDTKFQIKVSYLEIYNEQVKDLLNETQQIQNIGLKIVEDYNKGVMVPELTEYTVNNSEELLKLVLRGNKKRTMAATSANQFSSRSHAILQILVESFNPSGLITTAKLSLVDLAGSERASTAESKGMRMLEGSKINKSLLALGNCINMLSEKQRNGSSFIPYRDSKLTRLLKDSLGGNAKTVMIDCVSPAANCYEESINTLKYAERAKIVKNKLIPNIKEINHNEMKYKEVIESLKDEISSLKRQLEVNRETSKDKGYVSGGRTSLEEELLLGSLRTVNDNEIESLDEEIRRTKEARKKCHEELVRDSEDIRKSLQLSQISILDDNSYLNKLSQELLNKYEKHHELKESIQELTELEKKNGVLIEKYKKELEMLKKGGNKVEEERVIKKIEELKKNNRMNEEIRLELEDALRENTKIQQKYLETVTKLQSHRKKDTLEMQISLKSLGVEKTDLVIQNLEMKKQLQLLKLYSEQQNKKLSQQNDEVERLKDQLRQKDKQLEVANSQIIKQQQEIESLKLLVSTPMEQLTKPYEEKNLAEVNLNNKIEKLTLPTHNKRKPSSRYASPLDNSVEVEVNGKELNSSEINDVMMSKEITQDNKE
jgi:kinesin family protein 18/19